MYTAFQLAKKYIRYQLKASNSKGHGVHSPFVFAFIQNVLQGKISREDRQTIEHVRSNLKKDTRVLTLQDYGAGSAIENQKKRTVASIASHSLKSPKYSGLIYKIVRYFRSTIILELGTCLGVTTAYIAKANKASEVTTMEGAPEMSALAREVFLTLGTHNIRIIEGNFDDSLPVFLKDMQAKNKKLDLVFIDGNHREEPTVRYFDELQPLLHNDSVLIFDDIHWSAGMELAWESIKANKEVSMTIDLFFIGLVFFKKEFKVKQHFVLRY